MWATNTLPTSAKSGRDVGHPNSTALRADDASVTLGS
jgi:hypothetical protein